MKYRHIGKARRRLRFRMSEGMSESEAMDLYKSELAAHGLEAHPFKL